MNKADLRDIIRNSLENMTEYSYSDGAILFKTEYCDAAETAGLSNSSMLDTIARVLTSAIISSDLS